MARYAAVGTDCVADTPPDELAARLTLALEAGEARLSAWFASDLRSVHGSAVDDGEPVVGDRRLQNRLKLLLVA